MMGFRLNYQWMILVACLGVISYGQLSHASQPTLGDLKTFEVTQLHDFFGLDRDTPDAEFFPYLLTALLAERALPSGSPAEGVIHLRCEKGPECNELKAYVTAGWNGPEVWSKHYKRFTMFNTWWLGNLSINGRRFATKIIKDLATDYQASHQK